MGKPSLTKDKCQVKIDSLRGENKYKLIEYNGLSKSAKLKHISNNCNYIFDIKYLNNFLDGKGGCPICEFGVKNQNTETMSIRLSRGTNGEYQLIDEYKNMKTPVTIMHNKCKTKFKRTLDGVFHRLDSLSCPCCDKNSGGLIISYINDVSITNPKLASLFYNEDDTHKYGESSNQVAAFRCPFCGEKIDDRIDQVNRRGLSCKKCGDGISYPEKYIYNLLSQLNIKFDTQFTPDWAKPYRYDFVFEFNNIKYLVEADGHFHYKDCDFSNAEDVRYKDSVKDKLAFKYGYQMIRIDCNYDNPRYRNHYIKNSIINSLLLDIFDLSKIDFNECDKYASGSILYQISNDYNNGEFNDEVLCSKYQIKKQALMIYFRRAVEIGLISQSYKDICKTIADDLAKRKAIKIGHVVKCNETNEIFYSFVEPDKKYGAALGGYFKNHWNYTGHLDDGTKLTWTKIS